MNKDLLKAIIAVVEAKIVLAIESDHGRDSSHEYMALRCAEEELEAFFDKDTHELLAKPASARDQHGA